MSKKILCSRVLNYDAGAYTVQIGVYPNANNARRLSEEMKKIFGYSEVKSPSGKGERYYRVFAGRYSSFKAAEAAERNFSEHGYPASFVLSLE